MKTKLVFLVIGLLAGACGTTPFGQKVKEPFQGNAYESNARFFRGVGKGESSSDHVAKSKADLEAKTQLAGQMNTTMKQVADQYLGQTQNEKGADVGDKFQSLVREVMNTDLADIRKMGEQKYFDKAQDKYTVFIAYEIKKNAMFRFLKKQAKADKTLSADQQQQIEKIIDEELKKTEGDDK